MSGIGVGELIWLVLAALLGIGVVSAWIIKSEASRNFFKLEMKKLKAQLGAAEREKVMMIEEMRAFRPGAGDLPGSQGSGDAGPDDTMISKIMERTEELERDNASLKKELNEARSSLEEVYKELCSK